MSKSVLWSIVAVVVVAAAVIAVVILVPGNSNNTHKTSTNSNTLTSAQKKAYETTIRSNFMTFFSVSTPMQTRVQLLQNGSQFQQPMEAAFSQLSSQKPSVTINSVTFVNKTTAKVNYTVDLNGQPVLKDQNGEMLYINNNWLVSDSTLCQLLSLGGSTPAVCNGIR